MAKTCTNLIDILKLTIHDDVVQATQSYKELAQMALRAIIKKWMNVILARVPTTEAQAREGEKLNFPDFLDGNTSVNYFFSYEN